MKIGILTFHFAQNYGALLQAYALQRYLQQLGHSVEIINYEPDWVERGGPFRMPVSKEAVHADLVIAYQKLTRFKAFLSGKNLHPLFSDFRSRYLTESNRKYRTLEALRKDPPQCDVYVCGSDQIWNPSVQAGLDPAYFLDFGSARRVAYAASFGRNDVEDSFHELLSELLGEFFAIGVREKSGMDLVQRLSGRRPAWVPDPALLLPDYDEIIEPPGRDKDYLMSYVLRSGAGIGEVQQHIAERLNIEVVVPYNRQRRWKGVGSEVVCSPGQWLGLIKSARVVVTNSFHGTVFSILFKKPFITVALPDSKASLNDRMISMLDRLGLSDRMLRQISDERVVNILSEEIDWEQVHEKLSEWRLEARRYLNSALSQV